MVFETIDMYFNIIANIIVIIGTIRALFWIKDYFFEKKKKEIENNLTIRKNLVKKLVEHANGYDRSKPHDIGIRLVFWNNYPWKLDDDGYKQTLYYDTNMDKYFTNRGGEFLTNTGILIEEHIWFCNMSLYLGKHGTYIIDKSEKNIDGFQEVKQRIKLVRTLRYEHIINWDFEEKIEYEPVFYTKYKYYDKRLYENKLFAQNYCDIGEENYSFFKHDLDRRNRVKSIYSPKYWFLMLKSTFWQRKI